jgi:uncharacterized Zn finger protein (UPF0148 family)
MENKTCKKCKIVKLVENFYHHKAICKICYLAHNKEYREENKEVLKEQSKKWYERTKVSRRDHKAKYYRERRKTDLMFALKSSLGRLIRTSINRSGYKKNSKTNEILGCSYDYFKQYLEFQFEPWMNWNNRGRYNGELNYGWDIDHIIPLESAKTEEDVIKLNHYTNLKPLCSKINRDIKRNKF